MTQPPFQCDQLQQQLMTKSAIRMIQIQLQLLSKRPQRQLLFIIIKSSVMCFYRERRSHYHIMSKCGECDRSLSNFCAG